MGAYRQFSQTTLNASPKGLKKLNPSNWFGKSGTGSSASASKPWMVRTFVERVLKCASLIASVERRACPRLSVQPNSPDVMYPREAGHTVFSASWAWWEYVRSLPSPGKGTGGNPLRYALSRTICIEEPVWLTI